MVNDTTRLPGLDGLVVTMVDDNNDNGLSVVHMETADERARVCRRCGVVATRVKEWVTARPWDLPVGGRFCQLCWRKRRWVCE
ncbi:transposase family protein [Kutzneria buriramensis]|uniref:Transposase IS204/IS1001/IS1096/IS1165 family protein n=1 Tax=Kutzneria buriramensis TaxID=1045776 RepID=A0A3E0GTI8_9PSEU|nr:transposase family protein [Kutzneria buriramensis]REH27002.1 transposase IS204/IS1001/IS1096/IS1165 family protein [Kutzneria buriramensis]